MITDSRVSLEELGKSSEILGAGDFANITAA